MAEHTWLLARNPLAVAAFGAAALGAVAFMASDLSRTEGFGVARAVAVGPAAPAPEALSAQLDVIGREAHITSAQSPAWKTFSSSLLGLQALTNEFEARVASGNMVVESQERATHALMFGVALSEIDQALSPQQSEVVRRAVEGLMPTLICRGLAGVQPHF
jgi:hypothetical protein